MAAAASAARGVGVGGVGLGFLRGLGLGGIGAGVIRVRVLAAFNAFLIRGLDLRRGGGEEGGSAAQGEARPRERGRGVVRRARRERAGGERKRSVATSTGAVGVLCRPRFHRC
jgi:hypothetical protein